MNNPELNNGGPNSQRPTAWERAMQSMGAGPEGGKSEEDRFQVHKVLGDTKEKLNKAKEGNDPEKFVEKVLGKEEKEAMTHAKAEEVKQRMGYVKEAGGAAAAEAIPQMEQMISELKQMENPKPGDANANRNYIDLVNKFNDASAAYYALKLDFRKDNNYVNAMVDEKVWDGVSIPFENGQRLESLSEEFRKVYEEKMATLRPKSGAEMAGAAQNDGGQTEKIGEARREASINYLKDKKLSLKSGKIKKAVAGVVAGVVIAATAVGIVGGVTHNANATEVSRGSSIAVEHVTNEVVDAGVEQGETLSAHDFTIYGNKVTLNAEAKENKDGDSLFYHNELKESKGSISASLCEDMENKSDADIAKEALQTMYDRSSAPVDQNNYLMMSGVDKSRAEVNASIDRAEKDADFRKERETAAINMISSWGDNYDMQIEYYSGDYKTNMGVQDGEGGMDIKNTAVSKNKIAVLTAKDKETGSSAWDVNEIGSAKYNLMRSLDIISDGMSDEVANSTMKKYKLIGLKVSCGGQGVLVNIETGDVTIVQMDDEKQVVPEQTTPTPETPVTPPSTPENPTPDNPTPDKPTPDKPIPDKPIPDKPTPDTPVAPKNEDAERENSGANSGIAGELTQNEALGNETVKDNYNPNTNTYNIPANDVVANTNVVTTGDTLVAPVTPSVNATVENQSPANDFNADATVQVGVTDTSSNQQVDDTGRNAEQMSQEADTTAVDVNTGQEVNMENEYN